VDGLVIPRPLRRFAAAVILSGAIVAACAPPPSAGPRPLLDDARQAAAWLRNVAIESPDGLAWPAAPDAAPDQPVTNLYSGSAGVVLFFLELHHATGHQDDLDTARRGADWLLSRIDDETQAGLYTGLAGLAFALTETWKATGDDRYRDGANRVVDRLVVLATPAGDGVEWSGVSDVISGTAGIGLYLVSAAEALDRPDALALADAAGRRLIAQQIDADGGTKWAMTPANPTRLYPNFSHGTAGVAYFLATLHEATGEAAFLEAALDGARYLLTVAHTDGDVCLVFHHEPEPEGLELFYLGWCHGPAGTARLFHRLAEIDDGAEWRAWVRRAANGIRQSGIPQARPAGFWQNVGQCCGSASVADFFLSYHQATGDPDALAFARTMTNEIRAAATRDTLGLRWVHAEHRVQPDNLAAQTGWMQGAAGIGAWLLRLDGFDQGRDRRVVFPDDPF
jgi:lantibiotic modifying enzyme